VIEEATMSSIVTASHQGLDLQPLPLPPDWIVSGDPAPRGQVHLRLPETGIVAGVWECGAGRFLYRFRSDETVRIEAGAVTVTDEAGNAATLVPGDFAHFSAGSLTSWDVEDTVRKTFFIRTVQPPASVSEVPATGKRITVLDRRHAGLVDELRWSQYARAHGFAVKPAGILWNRSDDEAIVLGAWDGDALVATLRLEVIETQALVEAKIECPWAFDEPLRLPAMILSKMATSKAYRGTGLNETLRYHALRLAQGWGVRQVVGTFVAGSPRREAMATMGYRFFANDLGWTSPNYRSEQAVVVCSLDLTSLAERAMAVCGVLAGEALGEFAWEGELPQRRVVTVVS
jgi:uncharacterized cupin superfamily protein/GNAT superfamily N-acetyltransferase